MIPTASGPRPMMPEEWGLAIVAVIPGELVPDYVPGLDWRSWVDRLQVTAGGAIEVPDHARFGDFNEWADLFVRVNS